MADRIEEAEVVAREEEQTTTRYPRLKQAGKWIGLFLLGGAVGAGATYLGFYLAPAGAAAFLVSVGAAPTLAGIAMASVIAIGVAGAIGAALAVGLYGVVKWVQKKRAQKKVTADAQPDVDDVQPAAAEADAAPQPAAAEADAAAQQVAAAARVEASRLARAEQAARVIAERIAIEEDLQQEEADRALAARLGAPRPAAQPAAAEEAANAQPAAAARAAANIFVDATIQTAADRAAADRASQKALEKLNAERIVLEQELQKTDEDALLPEGQRSEWVATLFNQGHEAVQRPVAESLAHHVVENAEKRLQQERNHAAISLRPNGFTAAVLFAPKATVHTTAFATAVQKEEARQQPKSDLTKAQAVADRVKACLPASGWLSHQVLAGVQPEQKPRLSKTERKEHAIAKQKVEQAEKEAAQAREAKRKAIANRVKKALETREREEKAEARQEVLKQQEAKKSAFFG